MKVDRWLELFRRYSYQRIFHFSHLMVLSDMESHPLRIALNRLTRRGIIKRICRGHYANPLNLPGLEEISARLYSPSYISLESALSRYGILSQIPHVLTCVTTRLPREFRTSFGGIQYRQIHKRYFFGYVKEADCFLAEPEKALADFLYLNRRRNIRGMVSEFNLKLLCPQKLKSYAKRLNVKIPPQP